MSKLKFYLLITIVFLLISFLSAEFAIIIIEVFPNEKERQEMGVSD
jgi:hypothetical protein